MSMTENEAIIRCEKLINGLSVCCATSDAFKDENKGYMTFETMRKFAESCKNALEEIQSYRAIGTVDEFKDLRENQFFNFDSPVARVDKKSYDKAIDDLMNALCDHCMQQTNECYKLECPFCTDGCDIINIAEQLKGEKQ